MRSVFVSTEEGNTLLSLLPVISRCFISVLWAEVSDKSRYIQHHFRFFLPLPYWCQCLLLLLIQAQRKLNCFCSETIFPLEDMKVTDVLPDVFLYRVHWLLLSSLMHLWMCKNGMEKMVDCPVMLAVSAVLSTICQCGFRCLFQPSRSCTFYWMFNQFILVFNQLSILPGMKACRQTGPL